MRSVMLVIVFCSVASAQRLIFIDPPSDPKSVMRDAFTPTRVVKPSFVLTRIEADMLRLTNRERTARGLRPLVMDASLVRSARRHTQWMVSNRNMRHSSGVAENIAYGQRSPESVMNTWMNSRGHRRNILQDKWVYAGMSGIRTAGGTPYWTQQFSSRANAAPAEHQLSAGGRRRSGRLFGRWKRR